MRIAIVALILVVGVILLASYYRKSVTENQTLPATSATDSTTGATSPTATKAGTTSLTRNEAYRIYSARKLYVQLVDCIGFPGYLSMTRGTKFMIENLSSLPAVFTMQGQTVSLASKGFKIITATESGFYGAMCNGKNALKLQVSPN